MNATFQILDSPPEDRSLKQVAIHRTGGGKTPRTILFLIAKAPNDRCQAACVVSEDIEVRGPDGRPEAVSAVEALRRSIGAAPVTGAGGGDINIATGSFPGHRHAWQVLSRAASHFGAYLGVPWPSG